MYTKNPDGSITTPSGQQLTIADGTAYLNAVKAWSAEHPELAGGAKKKTDPTVFMGTQPGRLPAGAGIFDKYDSTPDLLRTQPNPNQTATKIIRGPDGEMTEIPVRTAGLPDKGTPPTNHYLSQTAALNAPLQWGTKKIKAAMSRATAMGYKVYTFADFLNVWQDSVKQAALAYDDGKGKKLSPWDMMQLLSTDSNLTEPGAAGPRSGLYTQTSTNSSVDDVDPAAAAAIVNASLSQYLGRDATDQEKADFLSRANGLAKSNPTVTKSTTTTNYDQGIATGSNTQTATSGGLTQDDLSSAAEDLAKQNPDYGAYQAATTAYGWLQQALGAAA